MNLKIKIAEGLIFVISNLYESATFVGVNDGIHNAEGLAKTISLSDNNNILRLEIWRLQLSAQINIKVIYFGEHTWHEPRKKWPNSTI